MSTAREKLVAKVAAVNRANLAAKEVYDLLKERFDRLVGSKILKVDGSLLSKYEHLEDGLPSDKRSLWVYRDSSRHSLMYVVKVCENLPGGNGCIYQNTSVYVGELEGQTLKSLYDNPFDGRSDYTVEEIEKKRNELYEAKRVVDQIKTDLCYFGEYDT